MNIVKSLLKGILTFALAFFFSSLLLYATILLTTNQDKLVTIPAFEMVQFTLNGLKELLFKMPFVGKILSVIVPNLTPSAISPTIGVEKAFRFVFLTFMLGWAFKLVYSLPDKISKIDLNIFNGNDKLAKKIDVGFQVVSFVYIVVVLTAVSVKLSDYILNFIRLFELNSQEYIAILIFIGVIFLVFSAEFLSDKPFHVSIILLIINLCITIIASGYSVLLTLFLTIDFNYLTIQDIIFIVVFTVILIPLTRFMIKTKISYNKKFKDDKKEYGLINLIISLATPIIIIIALNFIQATFM